MVQLLTDLKGVGPKTAEKLAKLGITTPTELVGFLPRNYIDLDAITNLDEAANGDFVLLLLEIVTVAKPFRKGKLEMFRAVGQTEGGKKVKLVWYNANYNARHIVLGRRIRCYAKLNRTKGYELNNPVFEVLGEGGEAKFSGIKAIYPTRGVVPQGVFLGFVQEALVGFYAPSILPDDGTLDDLSTSYQNIHFPKTMEDLARARERILLEEVVKRIAAYRLIKHEAVRQTHYLAKKEVLSTFFVGLPFALTPSQGEAIDALVGVLLSDKPLNAMVTGDVGSGKTVVAFALAYFAAMANKQVAIIAPTEVLALQHAKTAELFLARHGLNVVCMLGSDTDKEKRIKRSQVAGNMVQIVIGTHAVLSRGVDFFDLGLAVIDEQHRFGVAQRTALLQKGKGVDTLTLSATPIPRSLRLTMFGDVDVFSIEKRHESTNIQTSIVGREKRNAMLDYLVNECKAGKQAYLVAPKIYDSEGIEGDAAEGIYDEIIKRYPSEVAVGLLHGKQSAKQKRETLTAFAAGEIKMLVSTTVIEVGIDVPTASLMAVFDAERFGLASLHQLRGRIGRNGQQSYCFLYTEKEKEEELVRLHVLTHERDGMQVAEADYRLRGAGEWIGEQQSGKGALCPSIELMKKAKQLADQVDIATHYPLLKQEGERLNLNRVSLN